MQILRGVGEQFVQNLGAFGFVFRVGPVELPKQFARAEAFLFICLKIILDLDVELLLGASGMR